MLSDPSFDVANYNLSSLLVYRLHSGREVSDLTDGMHQDATERLAGEADVPIIRGALSEADEARAREREADEQYKRQLLERDEAQLKINEAQLKINESQLTVARSNRNLTRAYVILTGVLVLCTVAGFLISISGLLLSRKAAVAAENAAYQACLGARISQGALMETKKAGSDAHGSAVAAVYQAMAATGGERADIELILGNPEFAIGNYISVPWSVVDQGKTAAIQVHMKFRLVFIARNAEPDFKFPLKQISGGVDNRIPAGKPGERESHGVNVMEVDGTSLKPSEVDRQDYLQQRKDLILFGRITYMDIFGGHHWRNICETIYPPREGFEKESPHRSCSDYNRSDIGSDLLRPNPAPEDSGTIPEIVCTEPKQVIGG